MPGRLTPVTGSPGEDCGCSSYPHSPLVSKLKKTVSQTRCHAPGTDICLTVLDVRKLTLLWTRPRCATQ